MHAIPQGYSAVNMDTHLTLCQTCLRGGKEEQSARIRRLLPATSRLASSHARNWQAVDEHEDERAYQGRFKTRPGHRIIPSRNTSPWVAVAHSTGTCEAQSCKAVRGLMCALNVKAGK